MREWLQSFTVCLTNVRGQALSVLCGCKSNTSDWRSFNGFREVYHDLLNPFSITPDSESPFKLDIVALDELGIEHNSPRRSVCIRGTFCFGKTLKNS